MERDRRTDTNRIRGHDSLWTETKRQRERKEIERDRETVRMTEAWTDGKKKSQRDRPRERLLDRSRE